MRRIISKVIRSWTAWRDYRRLSRVLPAVVERRNRLQTLRKQHRPVKPIIEQNYNDIHAALGYRRVQ